LSAQSLIEIPARVGGKNRSGSALTTSSPDWSFADGGAQLTVRRDVAMSRRDPIHVDIQVPHVGRKVNRKGSGNFGRRRARSAWIKDIKAGRHRPF
jgi:hypothetical protein